MQNTSNKYGKRHGSAIYLAERVTHKTHSETGEDMNKLHINWHDLERIQVEFTTQCSANNKYLILFHPLLFRPHDLIALVWNYLDHPPE